MTAIEAPRGRPPASHLGGGRRDGERRFSTPPTGHSAGVQPAATRPHTPALDGLRALAVCAVVIYHLGFGWLPGGFLGVSLFMTLSGYLITTLVLDEFTRTGGVDLKRFWARRARRLLPAAYVVVAAVALLHAGPRGETLAALGYVSNWFQIGHHVAYSALFTAPSPLLHLWSLAVEEQYYLVLPVVALVALRWSGRRGLGVVLAGLTVGAVGLGLWLGNPSAYMDTGVRLAEFAIGGILAVIGARRVPAWAAFLSAAIIAALWITSRESSADLYRGVLVLHASAAAVVISWAVTARPRGLELAPLTAVGRASYALYLVHWPVFVLLHSPWPLKLAVTAALTVALHVIVENPARFAVRARPTVAVLAVGAGTALGACLLAPAPAVASGAGVSVVLAPAATEPAPPASSAGRPPTGLPLRIMSPSGIVAAPAGHRLLVIGDSTASYLVNGGQLAVDTHRGLIGQATAAGISVATANIPGCAYLQGWRSKLTDRDAVWIPAPAPSDPCGRWQRDLPALVASFKPDLVLFFAGPMLAREWASPDGSCVGTAETPCVRTWIDAQLDLIQHTIGATPVVWTTAPPAAWRSSQGGGEYMDDPGVVAAVNSLMRRRVHIDYATWFAGQPDQEALRLPPPDGTHLGPIGAARAAAWILGQLVPLLEPGPKGRTPPRATDSRAVSTPAPSAPLNP